MYTYLLIHEIVHASVYLLIALIVIHIFKPEIFPHKNMLLGLLVTIGMDADHLVEYYLYKKSLVFSLKEFIDLNYFELLGKTYLFLHAWEWIILLFIAHFILKKKYKFILFVALGMFAQLLVDSLSYGFDLRVYFITFRYLNNFDQFIFSTT